VYVVATAVAVAYRVGAHHGRLVGWVGLAASQYRRHTYILYATVMLIAVAYSITVCLWYCGVGYPGPTNHTQHVQIFVRHGYGI
jgi:hypothetical protein